MRCGDAMVGCIIISSFNLNKTRSSKMLFQGKCWILRDQLKSFI